MRKQGGYLVIAGVIVTGDKLSSVTRLNHRWKRQRRKFIPGVVDTSKQLIAVVVVTGDKHKVANIS